MLYEVGQIMMSSHHIPLRFLYKHTKHIYFYLWLVIEINSTKQQMKYEMQMKEGAKCLGDVSFLNY